MSKEANDLLPRRVVDYIHDVGVRSLDHLADHYQEPLPATPEGENASAPVNAIQTLVQDWKSMSPDDKELFVERVAASVMEIVVASATLPLGLKAGRKTAKVAKKAIRKQVKKVRKAEKKKDEGTKKRRSDALSSEGSLTR